MTDRHQKIRDALAGVAERESLRQRAAAWDAVADTLGEVCPEWINHPGTGTEAAVAAIRKLAQQPEARVVGAVAAECVATVCHIGVGPAYAHGNFYELQVQVTPGTKISIGDKLYTTPPAKVPEGLTARDRSVLRFALHRFMGEAYARHNEASQKTTAGLYAPGAAERFYRDAKDAERLLSVFAAIDRELGKEVLREAE